MSKDPSPALVEGEERTVRMRKIANGVVVSESRYGGPGGEYQNTETYYPNAEAANKGVGNVPSRGGYIQFDRNILYGRK